MHRRKRSGSYGRQLDKFQGRGTEPETHSRAGGDLVMKLGRQGQGLVTRRSETYYRTTDTQGRFWLSWRERRWERSRKALFVWFRRPQPRVSVKSSTLSELAHSLHSELGIIVVKVQIRWWLELEGASASGQSPVFHLIRRHRCQRSYAIEEVAELEDRQIWVCG